MVDRSAYYEANKEEIKRKNNEYYHANRDRMLQAQKAWREDPANRKRKAESTDAAHVRLRSQAFKAYGGVCACCGEAEEDFLTLEHTRRDGGAARKKLGTKGANQYTWLRQQGFPQDLGIVVLCANCQMASWRKRGCPHQRSD